MVRDGSKATEIRRGLARGALSDSTGAASDIRRSLAIFEALPTRDGERTFYLACSHAALAGLAEISGSSVSSAEGSSEAAAAMTILHEAIEMGYRVADAYQTEDALASLRNRPGFRLLMMDLAFPSDPFATAEQ